MQSQRPGDRQVALLISVAVGVVVAVITTATFYWIYELASGPERRAAAVAAAAPYNPSAGVKVITDSPPNNPTDGREPWLGLEAWSLGVQAGQDWVAANPNPLNVQVLVGMDSAQIWGYMQQHVSGALGVSCQYCHDINNFASETYPQKNAARNMLRLVRDVNAQYIVDLPNWRGNYVQCATCHNNAPVDMPTVGPQFVGAEQPINVVSVPLDSEGVPILDPAEKPEALQEPLPLEEAILWYIFNYEVWLPFEPTDPFSGRGSLALTYEGGRIQDQVNIVQGTMNYQAWSLNVGCTYCHSSRNFIAYELNAAGNLPNPQYGYNKLKAQQMMLLTTWMAENWVQYGALPKEGTFDIGVAGLVDDEFYYSRIDDQYYLLTGCYTCHRNAAIPKAAINEASIPPGDAGQVIFPSVLKGTQ